MTPLVLTRARARASASSALVRLALGALLAASLPAVARAEGNPVTAAPRAKPKPKKAPHKPAAAPAVQGDVPPPAPAPPKKKPAKGHGKRLPPPVVAPPPPEEAAPVPTPAPSAPEPPPEPPPAPVPEVEAPPPVSVSTPSDVDEPPAPPPRAPAPGEPWVTLSAGAEGGGRYFRQFEPSTGEVRTFYGRGIAGYAVDLEVRSPNLGPRAWLSLEGHYYRAVALSVWSRRAGPQPGPGAPVGGSSYRLDGRLHAKVRTAAVAGAPVVGLFAGVSKWAMDFDIAPAPDLEAPSGDYTIARGGAEIKVPAGPFAFTGEASFLYAFEVGAYGNRVATRAPLGAQGVLGVSFTVVPHLALKISADYSFLATRLTPLSGSGDAPAKLNDGSFMAGAAVVVAF